MHVYKMSNSLMKNMDVDSVFIRDTMSAKDWAKLELSQNSENIYPERPHNDMVAHAEQAVSEKRCI